jgi:hypothetical protein
VVALGRGNMQQREQDTVSQMLQSYNSIILQSYSPNLAPSHFHLFGPLNKHLEGSRFHNNEEVEMAVRERLRMQLPDLYCVESS